MYETQSLMDRLALEARAFARVFCYTSNNNNMEKTLLWFLLAAWTIITVGIAFGYAESTTVYSGITALVWALVGRAWGGEIKDLSSR